MLNYYDATGGLLTAPAAAAIVVKTKSGDLAKASDATYADDPDLSGWAVAADTEYVFDGILIPESLSTTPDVKIQFTGPSSSSFRAAAHSIWTLSSTRSGEIWTALSQSQSIPLFALADRHLLPVWGWLKTASVAGTFSMQWAQNTSDPTATTLLAGSWIRLTKV